ncbi:MAG TPA: MBL fold metallo-hydrolase RNA specificity domain-containing protein, partial [Bacillota bacterium]|nr:MBL fold metallo-hydrolase RNA specificity domain-containing protein [Bacillota bacterium]
STYGDRLHREAKNSTLALLDIITDTIERNGNVVIPSFAVERTQEILYILNMLKECESSTICNIPVYVDSPLAINATGIFQSFLPYMDEDTQKLINKGDNPFEFPNLIFTHTAEESKAINTKEGSSIIISASGMCEAGRIKHHLKHNLWRKESSVVFVGYQAKNTLGRRIKDGEKLVKIFGEEISVNCNIYSIEGFSSHADQRGLIDWVGAFMRKPKKVFLVHGEEESSKVLSKLMESELGIPVEVAKLGETVELSEAAAREITAESKSMDKYDLINYLRSLKANSGDTLDSLEYIISEGSNVKNDSLLYHLKKLEESIAELKKEIS